MKAESGQKYKQQGLETNGLHLITLLVELINVTTESANEKRQAAFHQWVRFLLHWEHCSIFAPKCKIVLLLLP
jgi:hypothetical protein